MSAPICPVNGRACAAACAGKPSCERAGAVVGRVRSAAVRKQAEDAVIEAARHYTEHVRPIGLSGSGGVRQALMRAVEALNALEAKE